MEITFTRLVYFILGIIFVISPLSVSSTDDDAAADPVAADTNDGTNEGVPLHPSFMPPSFSAEGGSYSWTSTSDQWSHQHYDLPPTTDHDPDVEVEIVDTFVPDECPPEKKHLRVGDVVRIYVNVSLTDGKLVDERFGKHVYLEIPTGYDLVFRGLEEGIFGMCEGQKRTLTVPPELGYGDNAGLDGKIAPNSILVMDVEMIRVKRRQKYPNMFVDMDMNSDNKISREEMDLYYKARMMFDGTFDPDNKEHVDNHERMLEIAFNRDDKNKDGFISFDEFSGPKGLPTGHDEL
ncbi:peptidyl-prolyl cis-trans isomerase FKBP14-like [Tubulanus polymorphus]|uniref:peptidyl-prolyl cis-trans isomerase FKBP14-like n=1 Tax=Tubulanus polymorphus TaxID=672921 RepID=UPI003DA41F8B